MTLFELLEKHDYNEWRKENINLGSLNYAFSDALVHSDAFSCAGKINIINNLIEEQTKAEVIKEITDLLNGE